MDASLWETAGAFGDLNVQREVRRRRGTTTGFFQERKNRRVGEISER